jgi:hypothetical protein
MIFANQNLTTGSARADSKAIQDFAAWSDCLQELVSRRPREIEHVVPHLAQVMRRIDDVAGDRPAAERTGP